MAEFPRLELIRTPGEARNGEKLLAPCPSAEHGYWHEVTAQFGQPVKAPCDELRHQQFVVYRVIQNGNDRG